MDDKVAGSGAASAAPTGTKAAAKPADAKRSITLMFEGADLELHQRIQDKADEEDRTPSIELLRFVRKHFGKTSA